MAALQPLNIGNVINTGLILYRSHLKPYLGVAGTGVLWFILPLAALIPLGIAFATVMRGGTVFPIIWLLIPVEIVLLCYSTAQYLLNSGVLARVAFQELINQPEAISLARTKLQPKLWQFFWLAVLSSVLVGAVYGMLALAGGITMFVIIGVLSLVLGPVIPAILGGIVLVVLVLGGLSWFYSRLITAEIILAVEDNVDVGQSLGRSWELSQTSAVRIQGVILVAFLVTLPLLLMTNYLPSLFLLKLEAGSPEYLLVYGISLITSFVAWIVQLPFWQTVKAVLYYDLRNRREGFGLQLRDRNT